MSDVIDLRWVSDVVHDSTVSYVHERKYTAIEYCPRSVTIITYIQNEGGTLTYKKLFIIDNFQESSKMCAPRIPDVRIYACGCDLTT